MAKKNVRDAPSKTQVTENPQMSDIVLVLDKMELLIQAVTKMKANHNCITTCIWFRLLFPTMQSY